MYRLITNDRPTKSHAYKYNNETHIVDDGGVCHTAGDGELKLMMQGTPINVN